MPTRLESRAGRTATVPTRLDSTGQGRGVQEGRRSGSLVLVRSTFRPTLAVPLARRHPLSLVSVGVVLYATGPVFVAASDATGPVFSLWRLWFGVGVLGLVTVAAVRTGGATWPRLRARDGRRAWRYAAWAGVAFGLHQLCFFTAVKATSVTDVTILAPTISSASKPLRIGWRRSTRAPHFRAAGKTC